MDEARIDQFDRKIMALLQGDARLTNNDLSERVNLSASQCSRRRQRLEQDGFIKGYRAVLDRDKLGFSLVNVISVTLATHNRDNAQRFAVTYNRKRRSMRTVTSELLRVPGIGPVKRRRLLQEFGSVQGVREAGEEAIAKLPGFNAERARKLLESLAATSPV